MRSRRPSGVAFKSYLRGDIKQDSSEQVAKWRASLPWSDEEIAAALRRLADEFESNGEQFMAIAYRNKAEWLLRTHMLYSTILRMAIPELIKTCNVVEGDAVCGKTALYRTGTNGRCRKHRMVTCQEADARRRRIEERSSHEEREGKIIDRQDRARRSLHEARKNSAHRSAS